MCETDASICFELAFQGSGKAFTVSWKASVCNVVYIGPSGISNGCGKLCILACKPRLEGIKHSKQVMQDQDLAITANPRANSNGRHGDCFGYLYGQRCGNTLKDHGKGSSVGNRSRIVEQGLLVSLNLVPAQAMHRLRHQADVPHHRNASIDQCRDGGSEGSAPLQFDGTTSRFFE